VSWRYIHASEGEEHKFDWKRINTPKGSLFSNLYQVPKSPSNILAKRPVFTYLLYNIPKNL